MPVVAFIATGSAVEGSGVHDDEKVVMTEAKERLTGLSEKQLADALRRYRAVCSHIDDGVPMAEVARTWGVDSRTVQRWVAAYERDNFWGLVRRTRSDRGKHRVHSDLQRLVEGLALQRPKLTVEKITQRACEVADNEGWRPPGYFAVYNIVKELDPALVTLARDGVEAYEQSFDLLYIREADRPNEVWQADHAELQVWALDDKQRPRKPWITLVEDDHSRAIAGYYMGFEKPSILRTSLAFRHAIWHKEDPRWRVCGIPETFYTDNGSDFVSNHIGHVAAELNVLLVLCTPGKPRGKGKVERFARSIGDMFTCGLDGYAPKENGGAKPKPAKGERLFTLKELDERFGNWIVESYNLREHGATKQKPLERWAGDGWLPPMPGSEDELDLLLMHRSDTRKVHGYGINFEREVYTDLALAAHVGKTIEIRYDPRDASWIKVYHEGTFICRATCKKLAGRGPIPLRELQRVNRKKKADLRAAERERKEMVAKLVPIRATGSPVHPPVGAKVEPSNRLLGNKRAPRLKKYRSE